MKRTSELPLTLVTLALAGIVAIGLSLGGCGQPDECYVKELPNNTHWAYCPQTDDDQDGIGDVDERLQGTDPQCWDTDGDGVEDGPDFEPLTPCPDGSDRIAWDRYCPWRCK